jgi:hypothetical protein
MKRQINSSIKAHLIRCASYLVLLIAICAIPFALAQRNAGSPNVKRSAVGAKDLAQVPKFPYSSLRTRGVAPAAPLPEFPKVSGAGALAFGRPPDPKAPQMVLYDQYDHASFFGTLSSTFTDFPAFSSDLADDFIVPAGQTWNVESIDADGVYLIGPADSFNVSFYADNAGLPGAQVFSATNQPFSVVGSTFTVNLPSPAVLTEGTYWVEIQANMTFIPNGLWLWRDRTMQSNNGAAWQNPGGGFGVCQTWTLKTTCIPFAGGPDQVFRLDGTSTGGTPTPTPSASPTPTATPAPGCGLLVGDGLAIGFAPNNFTLIASNIVNYTFSNSQAAPNDFAIFQTHDPFGATIVEDAITAAGHTFSVFTPAQLGGFDFTQYRVIILNWDDHFISDFISDYAPAIPALEAYVSGGGVVWVQGAILGEWEDDSYPLPFGGQSHFNLSFSDPIIDPSSAMVQGVPSPIIGFFASNASDEDLPDAAHVVVVNCHDEEGGGENCGGDEQKPVLYDLRGDTSCGGSPTPTPSPSASPTSSPSASPTSSPSASPTPRATPRPPPNLRRPRPRR